MNNSTNQNNLSCEMCGAQFSAAQLTQAVITCQYCGQETSNTNTNTNVSHVKGATTVAKGQSLRYVPFEYNEEDCFNVINEWLSDANIKDELKPSGNLEVKKLFYPFYIYKGSYAGIYDLQPEDAITDAPLECDFIESIYVGDITDLMADFDFKKVKNPVVLNSVKTANFELKKVDIVVGSIDEYWETTVKKQIEASVEEELSLPNGSAKTSLKFTFDESYLIYYPIWSVEPLTANSTPVFVDGVDGDLYCLDGPGSFFKKAKPEAHYVDYQGAKNVFKHIGNAYRYFKDVLLYGASYGVILWFIYYVVRAFKHHTNLDLADTPYHNILVSKLFDTYWKIRGAIIILGTGIIVKLNVKED